MRAKAVIGMVTAGAVGLGIGACSAEPPAEPPAEPTGVDLNSSIADEFVLDGVEAVAPVARLVGPGAINDTEPVAVAGTDLGSMVNAGDRTYFFFGDTFGVRGEDAVGGVGSNWRSNVVAWTTDDEPADGIVFDGWLVDDLGLAREIAPGLHQADDVGEVTKIPTYGFEVDGALYVHFMSVRHWGDAGEWDANYSGLVRSDDGGATWTVLDSPQWDGDSGFVQVSAARVSEGGRDYIYLWGIPAGRFGSVSLMRVDAEREAVEDQARYEYFAGLDADGDPRWSPDEVEAAVVLDGAVGEFSVVYSDYLHRWLISYMADNQDAVLAEGLSPWGPWGEPFTLTTQGQTPGLYAPYLNPRYVSDDGRRIYFTLSVWGPYAVFWYQADLIAARAGEAVSPTP